MTPRPEPRPRAATPAPRAPKPASSTDPWARLRQDLRALGGAAAVLAAGTARLDRGVLLLQFPAGRTLAEARAALKNPAVVEVVRQHYPGGTTLEVAALAGTGSKKEQADALKRQVLADPEVQRILAALGGDLQRVIPHKE